MQSHNHIVSIRHDGLLISDVMLKKGKCFNRELTEKNIANTFYGELYHHSARVHLSNNYEN